MFDGSSFKSSLLYPGIRPGSSIACSSAKLEINFYNLLNLLESGYTVWKPLCVAMYACC